MKKIKLLIPSLFVLLFSSTCSASQDISSSLADTGLSTMQTTSSDKVYDTSGNEITSGSATLSFVYRKQTTTKTISANYLIDRVSVNIESGDYLSASSSSNQVVFLVINGGKLNITGTTSSYVQISKSRSAASDGQVDDDYNFYGINSGIVVSGSSSEATIKYANITTSGNGSNAIVDFPTRFAPSSKTAYLPSNVFFQSNSLSYAFLLNRIHSPFLDFIKQVDKIQSTNT